VVVPLLADFKAGFFDSLIVIGGAFGIGGGSGYIAAVTLSLSRPI
jgi:hypothetical protein